MSVTDEKSISYDPIKAAPFTMSEKVAFNTAVVYITLVSSFIFALMMSSYPSFLSAFVGLLWATPGLIVLWGFYSGRAKQRIRRLHTSIFIAEVIFLVFAIYMCTVALKGFGSKAPDMIAAVIDIVMYILYVLSLEVGIFRLVKKHEKAYYLDQLKG